MWLWVEGKNRLLEVCPQVRDTKTASEVAVGEGVRTSKYELIAPAKKQETTFWLKAMQELKLKMGKHSHYQVEQQILAPAE